MICVKNVEQQEDFEQIVGIDVFLNLCPSVLVVTVSTVFHDANQYRSAVGQVTGW